MKFTIAFLIAAILAIIAAMLTNAAPPDVLHAMAEIRWYHVVVVGLVLGVVSGVAVVIWHRHQKR